jgi:hypothetical protein
MLYRISFLPLSCGCAAAEWQKNIYLEELRPSKLPSSDTFSEKQKNIYLEELRRSKPPSSDTFSEKWSIYLAMTLAASCYFPQS